MWVLMAFYGKENYLSRLIIFYDKRDNMLISPSVTVPLEYGIELPQVNGGKMSNQGIEIMLSSTHTFANTMKLDLSGNFTYTHNKLLHLLKIPKYNRGI